MFPFKFTPLPSLPMTVLSFSTCFTPLRTLLTLTLSCWACFLFSWEKKIFFLFNQKRTSAGSYHLICLLTCIYDFSPETMDGLPVFLAKAFSFLLFKEMLSQQFSLLHYQHFPLHWISLFGEKNHTISPILKQSNKLATAKLVGKVLCVCPTSPLPLLNLLHQVFIPPKLLCLLSVTNDLYCHFLYVTLFLYQQHLTYLSTLLP